MSPTKPAIPHTAKITKADLRRAHAFTLLSGLALFIMLLWRACE